MTLKEFRDWLRHIETAYPVYEWQVDGLQVWPMIRGLTHGTNFHGRMEGSYVGAGGRAYVQVLLRALTGWVRAMWIDHAQNERPDAPADAVFLAYSIGVQPLLGGRRFNPLLAPYVELLSRKGLRSRVWEMSPHGEYNVPRYTPSTFVQPLILFSRIVSLIRPGIRFEEFLSRYDEVVAEADAVGLEFPYRKRKRLHRDVYGIRCLAHVFRRWLRRVGPRIVFVADASLREQALCLVCREMGITSVEIQHGVQRGNPTYAEFHALPACGMLSRASAFWTWDETSAAAISGWAATAPSAHTVILGGDPWLEIWFSRSDPLVVGARAQIAAQRAALGGSRHILVTLSSIEEVVPPIIAEVVRKAPPDWRWWFRMHPVNQAHRLSATQEAVRALGCDVNLMTSATEAPLFALLHEMDAHLTAGFSTVVQQAAAFGVPSVGCHSTAADLFAAEVATDILRMASDADAVIRALHELMARPRHGPAGVRPDGEAGMDRLLELGR